MKPQNRKLDEFRGLLRLSCVCLVIGLIGCAVGAVVDRRNLAQSYLLAYLAWVGIPLGCLLISMLYRLVEGEWGRLTARIFESASSTLPLMAILFVPVALSVDQIYPWARQELVETDPHLAHKSPYLNAAAFQIRAVLYWGIWIVLGWLLNRGSLRLDVSRDPKLAGLLRRLSAGGILIYSLAISFAAIDWAMSLEPLWSSTIYGLMIALGGIVAAAACGILLLSKVAVRPDFLKVTTPDVLNDLGNLQLAFLMLWAYVSFSQYLIIWSGDQPVETRWYLKRLQGGWQWVALAMIAFGFFVPFLSLLMREVKRDRRRLAGVCGLLLGIHFIDVFWIIAPAFRPQGLFLHWLDLATWLAIGGAWGLMLIWQMKQRPLLAVAPPATNLRPTEMTEVPAR